MTKDDAINDHYWDTSEEPEETLDTLSTRLAKSVVFVHESAKASKDLFSPATFAWLNNVSNDFHLLASIIIATVLCDLNNFTQGVPLDDLIRELDISEVAVNVPD